MSTWFQKALKGAEKLLADLENRRNKEKKEMKVSEAKFTRRYNVAQYEHEELSLTAIVEDDENAVEVLTQLKADVEAAHTGDVEEKSAGGKKGKKAKPVEKEEEETEETTDEEETEEETTDEEEEETEEEKPAKGKKPAAGKKNFRKKPQVYQRANEAHKEIFSGVLKVVAPKWKATEESKALAKKVSQKMEGDDFLDEDGEVLASFKEQLRKSMAGKK